MTTSTQKYSVAVVGATGAVGKQMLKILEQRQFPMGDLRLFASERSVGKKIHYQGRDFVCEVMKPGCFDGVDFAFFDASDAVSKEWVKQASDSGAWVIDNSATYRMDSDVLLTVPEVHEKEIQTLVKQAKQNKNWKSRVFAGPNCSTVQMVLPLKVLRDLFGLKRVIVSTYQATSGAGAAAMDELREQTRLVLDDKPAKSEIFSHRIAFNCIPHIGGFKDDGYTSEEHKLMAETKRILGMPDLAVTATAVRVPTFACHSESVYVECDREPDLAAFRKALSTHAGISLIDEPEKARYPLAEAFVGDAVEPGAGRDPVYVGRIRRDPQVKTGICFWVVSDNLRKGAALNAIQIGEAIIRFS